MYGLLRKIARDLLNRRIRTALTILGIAVGVAGLVAIVSTSRNVARAQEELFADISQADLTFWLWNAPPNLAPLVQADPRVAAAELRVSTTTRWRTDGGWADIELVGLDDPTDVRVNRFDLVAGRLPTAGEIALDVSAARAAGIEPGDEITYRDAGRRERTLRVSGITRSPSYLSSAITNVAVGYVPARYLRRTMDIPGGNRFLVRLHDVRDGREMAEHLGRLLRRQGIQFSAPLVRDPDQYPGRRELDALIMVMFLFSGLGLLLSAFLVANTLSAAVTEQVGEIGILKTLGAGRNAVVGLYLLESGVCGAAGTLLGVAGGALAGWRLVAWIGDLGNAEVAFRLAPEGVLLGMVVGVLVSLVGGLVPALQGARISIKDALESYGIRADYGQGRLDRLLGRMRRLPSLVAMALRNLARRKGRSALTLGVVALSTAAFLGAASTRDSVNAAIDDIYATYYADAWVWFGENLGVRFENSLATVNGVREAEGWAIANGHVGLAEARLYGVPAESNLYRQVMRQGRWYLPEETDAVVLTAELADGQGLRVGDAVAVQVSGQERIFRVVGVAIDNTIFLGGQLEGKAFVPRDTLTRMQGRQGQTSLFALGLDGREPAVVDDILAGVETRFARWRPGVQPVYAEIESANEASRLLTLALSAMIVLVAAVGALGILNTLTLNVLERRREIAVMRVVGATDPALLLAFISEGLALGGVGWIIGLALGYPAGRLLTTQMSRVLFELRFFFSPQAVLMSLIFTLALATVSSLGPALAAAHTRADDALRYE
jgi:putative ABC transport system permease protein